MEKVQIQLNQLMKDGYVFQNHDEIMPGAFPFFVHSGKTYFFTHEVENGLNRTHLFYCFLFLYYTSFKQDVEAKLSMIPDTVEDRVKLYENLIREQNELYKQHLGEISVYNNPEYHFYNWKTYCLEENPIEVIFSLVYDFAQQDFDSFLAPIKKRAQNNISLSLFDNAESFRREFNAWITKYIVNTREKVAEFERLFITKSLRDKTYFSFKVYENIKYLKQRIFRLQNPHMAASKTGLKEFPIIDAGENVFCKGMPFEFVINHFQILTTKESANGKPFLTQVDLKAFINKAFKGIGNSEKLRFNYVRGEKLKIQNVFFDFYNESKNNDYDQRAYNRDSYIKLLSDNFTGFPFEKTKSNFSKKVKQR